ncbi:MAG TPA: class I SAM-dependent methyltransferase [bacterium]|nr:class I SAM-dependent methyltransferase [bacterium]
MILQGEKMFDASFDIFANNYDDVRPGYPTQMYEDIRNIGAISEKSSLLEIGVGSGIATVELAKFGCRIIGIEPGANLVTIARQKTVEYPKVQIKEAMFEEFMTDEKFDLVLALTSFHWISEYMKYKKVFDLLNNNGCFVLVWNSFFQSDSPVAKEINALYQEVLPDIYPPSEVNVNISVLRKLNSREKEIHESDLFYIHFLRKYVTVCNYDADTYPKLLNTFPKIIKVDKKRRQEFLDRVGLVVKKYGKISIPLLTTLIICKKRDNFLSSIGNF